MKPNRSVLFWMKLGIIGFSFFGVEFQDSCDYSIFTSSAYRNRDAEWRFPQEIAINTEAKTQACEVKML